MRQKKLTLVIFIFAIIMMTGVLSYIINQMRYSFYFGGIAFLAPIIIFATIVIFIIVSIGIIISIVKPNQSDGNNNGNNRGYFTDSYIQRDDFYIKGNNCNEKYNILKCPMCDTEIERDQKFCDNCGYNLKDRL